MEEKKRMFVTTDTDLWNSADDAHFFVTKGQVKELPEVTTPIIEDGLNQGLLREATPEELSKQLFSDEVEKALIEKKITVGKTYAETVSKYQAYVEANKMVDEEVKEEVVEEAPVEEVVADAEPVADEEVVEEVEEDSEEEKPEAE